MNAYYLSGKLDRNCLRVSAVYRLLEQRRIIPDRAVELLANHTPGCKPRAVVEVWTNDMGPLSERGRRNRAAWAASLASR